MKHTLKNQMAAVAVRKRTFANAVDLSARTIDRYIAAGILPQIKLPSAPGRDGRFHGTVLIPVDAAVAALNLFRADRIAQIQLVKEIQL